MEIGTQHLKTLTGACATNVGKLISGTKWQYGKITEQLEIGSATQCCNNCDAHEQCFHWSFNHQKNACRLYGDDGYPEQRPPFHEWVTGHSTLRKSQKHTYPELQTGGEL